jgi:hypothetical protein
MCVSGVWFPPGCLLVVRPRLHSGPTSDAEYIPPSAQKVAFLKVTERWVNNSSWSIGRYHMSSKWNRDIKPIQGNCKLPWDSRSDFRFTNKNTPRHQIECNVSSRHWEISPFTLGVVSLVSSLGSPAHGLLICLTYSFFACSWGEVWCVHQWPLQKQFVCDIGGHR